MKRALIFNSSALQCPTSGAMVEEAYELLEQGYEVHIAYCSGVLGACYCNPEGNAGICSLCRFCSRNLYAALSSRCRILPLSERRHTKERTFSYASNEEIEALAYKGVCNGYGALSNYVSLTRDAAPVVNAAFKSYFDGLLNDACWLIDVVEPVVRSLSPDVVSCFNGRKIEQRVFMDLAFREKIAYRSVELTVDPSHVGVFYKLLFDNTPPNDIVANDRLMRTVWELGDGNEAEKTRQGLSFFEKRASGTQLNWFDPSYIGLQDAGALPKGFDGKKKNIVIFNSSEEEFVAVGKEFDAFAVFKSQLEGLRYVLNGLRDSDYRVYLRVHPNLRDVAFRHHLDLYKLEAEYPNLCVIPADGQVSTYALMRFADKVVVFGSTAGIEAAYMGKPVVLLAGSFYYFLGVAYTPKTPEEALALIRSDLKPLGNEAAFAKFGYYALNDWRRGRKPQHVDLTRLILKPAWLYGPLGIICKYQKLFGSYKFMAVVIGLWVRLVRKFGHNRCQVPHPVGFRWI